MDGKYVYLSRSVYPLRKYIGFRDVERLSSIPTVQEKFNTACNILLEMPKGESKISTDYMEVIKQNQQKFLQSCKRLGSDNLLLEVYKDLF